MTPPEELRAAADRALREDPVGALAYGAGSGYAPLREWIAERNAVERPINRLKQHRAIATRYDKLAVSTTAGWFWPPCSSGSRHEPSDRP